MGGLAGADRHRLPHRLRLAGELLAAGDVSGARQHRLNDRAPMANSLLWQILWVIAAVIAGALMFGAWTGPHRSVSEFVAVGDASAHPPCSGLAQSAGRRPVGVSRRPGCDGAVAWRWPGSFRRSDRPRRRPPFRQQRAIAPAPSRRTAGRHSAPDRHIDAELKNAILVHVPKDQAGQARGSERRRGGRSICLGDRRVPQSRRISPSCRACFLRWPRAARRRAARAIYPDEKDSEYPRHQDRAERPQLTWSRRKPDNKPAPETGAGFVIPRDRASNQEPLPAGISSYLPSLPHL